MTRDNRKRYHFDALRSHQTLATYLALIDRFQQAGDYEARNRHVYNAMSVAVNMGLDAGIRIDPEEPEWPVIYIELPTGQVSWHVPQHCYAWDQHTDEEKNARVDDYVEKIYFRSAR